PRRRSPGQADGTWDRRRPAGIFRCRGRDARGPMVPVGGGGSAMFLRNCWYVAGWADDFAEAAVVCRTMLDDPIVLYRKGDGGIVALEDRCCHRLAPLSRGRIEGDDLRCMY